MENELLGFQKEYWRALTFNNKQEADDIEKRWEKHSKKQLDLLKKEAQLKIIEDIYDNINYLDSLAYANDNNSNWNDYLEFLKESKNNREIITKFASNSDYIYGKKFVVSNKLFEEKMMTLENPVIEFKILRNSLKDFQSELESEISSPTS